MAKILTNNEGISRLIKAIFLYNLLFLILLLFCDFTNRGSSSIVVINFFMNNSMLKSFVYCEVTIQFSNSSAEQPGVYLQ